MSLPWKVVGGFVVCSTAVSDWESDWKTRVPGECFEKMEGENNPVERSKKQQPKIKKAEHYLRKDSPEDDRYRQEEDKV